MIKNLLHFWTRTLDILSGDSVTESRTDRWAANLLVLWLLGCTIWFVIFACTLGPN